ncbi:MAG: shikimate dehydrogenase [Paracoccaceae bacterium]
MKAVIKVALGLIGDNIRRSRSPDLHRACGRIVGLDVSYELFIPPDMGLSFDEVFALCLTRLDGFNVTLHYKERAAGMVRIEDPLIRRLGAINTVLVGSEGPVGWNTDFTGFTTAYRQKFGCRAPGEVVMFGAGGVGRAIAFALVRLGAASITILDTDEVKAARLAETISEIGGGTTIGRMGSHNALPCADGAVNCTPLGMEGYPGSPLATDEPFPAKEWAFDAVYTPFETPFRDRALDAGAVFLSGYDLFFYQGLDAFRLFTGRNIKDWKAVRRALVAQAAEVER